MSDVKATMAVLDGQLELYEDLPRHPAGLFSHFRDPESVDLGGKLKWSGEDVVLTFGKHRGESLWVGDQGHRCAGRLVIIHILPRLRTSEKGEDECP